MDAERRPWRDFTLAPPGARGARRILSLLALAAVIPSLLLVAWTAFIVASQERESARKAVLETTSRVAERVAADLLRELQVLQTLAASPALETGDFPRLYEHARRLARERPLWETVSLADAQGRQVLNLLRPLGHALAADPDPRSFEDALRLKRPVIGGVGPRGPVSGKALIALRVPVVRDGAVAHVLTVGLDPGGFSDVLRKAGAPREWIGVVLDAQGAIVARTSAEHVEQGRPASSAARDAVVRAARGFPQGFYVGDTLEGVSVESAYRALEGTDGWSVHFGIPRDSLNAPVDRSLALLVSGGAVSLVLAAALVGLAIRDIDHRRKVEEDRAALALALSEERGAEAIEAAELGTWRWLAATGEVTGSSRTRALLGLPAVPGGNGEGRWQADGFLAAVHPEDRPGLREALAACLHEGARLDLEFRTVRPDTGPRWVRATGRLVALDSGAGAGEPAAIHGVLLDIEPQKRAEFERRALLRRLASSQEDERRRIARELHDQVGQSVTALSLGLKSLERQIEAGERAEARDQVDWLRALVREVGLEIHRASSDLRPTALDDLGLERALSAFVAEWGRRFGIDAQFHAVGLETRLPSEIETAVYRAVQEALTNVLKHAAAREVSVVVERRGGELRVVVEDDGRGFDPEAVETGAAPEAAPLGLSGIRERLALVTGRLRIESAPGRGASLFMTMPLPEGERSHA